MNTTDPKQSNYGGPCPRCGGAVPNAAAPGKYPGALSRYDNETYICSGCGQAEAMWQYVRSQEGLDITLPPVNEPVPV